MFNHFFFSLFDVLLLVGIIQGFITIFLILLKYQKQTDKILLALILFIFNLLCFRILSHTLHFWDTNFFRYFPLPVELVIGPLLWLYILSLIKSPFKLQQKQLIHFLPFFFSFCYGLFVYIQVLGSNNMHEKDQIAASLAFSKIRQIEDILTFISAAYYWYLGFKEINKYRHWLFANTSASNYPTYNWLKNILLLLSLFVLVFIFTTAIEYLVKGNNSSFIYWKLFFCYLAMLIYYLAFQGYRVEKMNPNLHEAQTKNNPACTDLMKAASVSSMAKEISSEKMAVVKAAILQGLEVKELYLNPELNLQTFAEQIQINSTEVSATIKLAFNSNFRNLINQYRVQRVKEIIKQDRAEKLSLLGIAYESGFNSEASFYRIFKSTAGTSPKEYMNQHSKKV